MLRFLSILFLFFSVYVFCKPMESLTNYNVIMVHGAAADGGMNCEDKKEAYEEYGNIFGSADLIGKRGYKANNKDDRENDRPDLTYWLDSAIFENVAIDKEGKRRYLSVDTSHFSSIYHQRPFINPAEAPSHNAREIGDSKWKCGNDGKRRSLIEEAQEVKAKGQNNLKNLRKDVTLRDKLPPSSNILIAHSMGGVASREYVQSDSIYNDDVDKIITLDSPHKGTHSLDGYLHLNQYIQKLLYESGIQYAATHVLAWGLSAIVINGGPLIDDMALVNIIVGTSIILNGVNAVVDLIVTDIGLGYNYKDTDPLVDYIRPGSNALKKLNSYPYTDNLPMMRILNSEGGLTIGSHLEYGQNIVSIFIPDALYVPIKNTIAQLSHTEIDNPAYLNNILASFALGFIGEISLTDHGSVLIPHWSGSAQNIGAFSSHEADKKYYTYNGNTYTSMAGVQMVDAFMGITSALVAAKILGIFNPALETLTRTSIAIVAGTALAGYSLPSVIAATLDMIENHKAPVLGRKQKIWKGTKNTYAKITGEQETYEPYLMEEFLYEKPFVNVRVISSYSSDWKDLKSDTLGLHVKDSTGNSSPLYLADNLSQSTPLKFKSSSDWETMGAKKERWEITTGVGNEKIPIRHADRYPLPPIMVKDYIEKYEFEVDDLMPHRLRQIRINFNFNEDLAWECDVNKPEGDANV